MYMYVMYVSPHFVPHLVPTPNVTLTASLYQVPTHTDYNSVTLSCSDALPSDLKDLAIDKQYSWTVNGTGTTTGVQGPFDEDERESYGSLTISITDLGTIAFTCTVSIQVPGDPIISSNASITVTALGKDNHVIIVCIHVYVCFVCFYMYV